MADENSTFEIILAGSGGQGLVSSGIMLGEAAILEGKEVMQTTSYGIAQRGGLSLAEVIISSEEIFFQHVLSPDIVLALTDESLSSYMHLAQSGVTIFYDSTLIKEGKTDRLYGYPFTEMAGELGHLGVVNIIALGAVIAESKMVRPENMERVLRRHFSGKIAELNVKALSVGRDLYHGLCN